MAGYNKAQMHLIWHYIRANAEIIYLGQHIFMPKKKLIG